jgi:thiamine transport system permease protein
MAKRAFVGAYDPHGSFANNIVTLLPCHLFTMSIRLRYIPFWFFFALPLGFLALFFLFPLAAILRLSFADGMAGVAAVLGVPTYWRVLGFTLWQATLSTVLTLALGIPGAYVFARYRFPGKALLRAVAGVPFVMPTVVVAAAANALIGPRGVLNEAAQGAFDLTQPPIRLQGTLAIILLAHAFYNYTVVLRLVGGFWANLDLRMHEAATMLGASPWRVFRTITLPLLLPPLGAAALLIFILCFTSFGVIVILGGPRFATLEVEIYRQTAQLLRLDRAATLALIQIICTLLLTLAYGWLAARSAVPLDLQPRSAVARRPRTWRQRTLVGLNGALILLLLGGPLLALALRSITTVGGAGLPTLQYYAALNENRTGSAFFVPPITAIANSLRVAGAATLIALIVGIPAAYLLARRDRSGTSHRLVRTFNAALDALFTLPLGTSAVTLGLGYLVVLTTPLLAPLRSAFWLVPVLHALVGLPFVVRVLLPMLRARTARLREAATMLGAAPWRAWRDVELPRLLPGLITAAAFAFTVSLGEFGATLLLARPDAPTLPVLIFRFLGQPGAFNYGQAMALSTILMLLTATIFVLLERVRPPGGEF